ncbi:MAG: U32 family peptidase C-terminal domain-containing protein [Patescibacteria group bacterium]|jgi:putative protease
MKINTGKPELLAPAGTLDILKIAFMYGADAVYCGTPAFAMRSRVGFDIKSLGEGIEYAHSLNKKVYVTLNSFPHSTEIEKLGEHVAKIAELKPDAFIVADPGVMKFVLDNFDIPVHLSTQANTTNQLSAQFWADQGIERLVLARELSLKDIALIHKTVPNLQIETFVHGAMCMAHSGRCQISNYFAGRDPNKGACIQACRFKYKMYALEEEYRPGELFPIYEDEEGTHILNSKDLCMIDHLDDIVKSGVISLKIEGRLKSEYYVATVVGAYRKAIDLLFSDPAQYQSAKAELLEDVSKAANRGLTTGFYYNEPDKDTNNYASAKTKSEWGYVGRVISYDKEAKLLKFEAKNFLPVGAEIEILAPEGIVKSKITQIIRDGEVLEVAHSGYIVEIPLDKPVCADALIRMKL